MSERLYHLRPGQVAFETGTARGKQLLLATTVHDILLHWFTPDGAFLELERRRMAVAPATFPASPVYQTDSSYWEQVDREVAALKKEIGFIPAEIAIAKFESAEAGICDLPGDYEKFLEDPQQYAPEERAELEQFIQQWRKSGCFVLDFYEQYWMSAAGEIESS